MSSLVASDRSIPSDALCSVRSVLVPSKARSPVRSARRRRPIRRRHGAALAPLGGLAGRELRAPPDGPGGGQQSQRRTVRKEKRMRTGGIEENMKFGYTVCWCCCCCGWGRGHFYILRRIYGIYERIYGRIQRNLSCGRRFPHGPGETASGRIGTSKAGHTT